MSQYALVSEWDVSQFSIVWVVRPKLTLGMGLCRCLKRKDLVRSGSSSPPTPYGRSTRHPRTTPMSLNTVSWVGPLQLLRQYNTKLYLLLKWAHRTNTHGPHCQDGRWRPFKLSGITSTSSSRTPLCRMRIYSCTSLWSHSTLSMRRRHAWSQTWLNRHRFSSMRVCPTRRWQADL